MNNTTNQVKSLYTIMSDFYHSELNKLHKGSTVLFSKHGKLKQVEVDDLALDMEALMKKAEVKKKYVKAFFSIIIEALQNIRIHGEGAEEKDLKPCYYIVAKTDNSYYLTTANFIKEQDIDKLSQKVNYVNNLSPEGLKEYYFNTLSEGSMSAKGGAGLGIITLATKSNKKLEYSITELENTDFCVFRVTTTVNLTEE